MNELTPTEISCALNRIYPEFERINAKRGFFYSRAYISIEVNKERRITGIRMQKLNFLQRLFRKIFGTAPQHIAKIAELLKGRIDRSKLDQNGRMCVQRIVSCWHRTQFAKERKCPVEPFWYWPKEIPDSEQQCLERYLSQHYHRTTAFPKHHTIGNLPRTLFQLPSEMVILLLDQKEVGIAGEGAEHKVKLGYNLSLGEYCVKREINREEELQILKHFYLYPHRGIVQVLGFREMGSKLQVIQPKYDENLKQAILGGNLSFDDKLKIIQDLFEGLSALHGQCNLAHHDIKPANILVRNKNEAALIDFGFAGSQPKMRGTKGYMPPEYVNRWYSRKPQKLSAEQRNELGQKKDVWGMGVTIACLMIGYGEKGSAAIPSLQKSFSIFDNKRIDRRIAYIKQEEIDRDIENILSSHPKFHAAVWRLIHNCLKVNPHERLTSDQALQEINRILA